MSAELTDGPIGAPLLLSGTLENVSARIGALSYDVHSWRYHAACQPVEAGRSDDFIAAVKGQSSAMVMHYTKKVRQKVRAIQAQKLRNKNNLG